MAVHDPYADEEAVQINPELYEEWKKYEDYAAQYAKMAEMLKRELIKQLGNATAGMVGSAKVVTHRPTKRYATSRLQSERADLAQHFIRMVAKEEFDFTAFQARHPDVAEEYRVRSFRLVSGGDDDA